MDATGALKERLSEAMLSAFRKPQELERMLSYKLDVRLSEIVAQGGLRNMVFELIEWADAEGRLDALVRGAHLHNPGNPLLRRFHDAFFSLAQPKALQPELEKIVVAANPFHDVVRWRTELAALEPRLCRIEVGTHALGTGFLVAPGVVLTNHHVIQGVLDKEYMPDAVRLRFDFKRAADGISVGKGQPYVLAKDWLIDSSPASPVDEEPEPKSAPVNPEHLDHALLRVEGAPEQEQIGDQTRGVIPLPRVPYVFAPQSALIILQHPDGEPLQMAFDTEAVLGVNGNGTRVTYRTNTLPGSSGSPCFNVRWELVALHHLGGPKQSKTRYNEGIPISALRAHLEKKGLTQSLGL